MNIGDTVAPKSDQLDAVDLVTPRIFTITGVRGGNSEQPVQIDLAEFERTWRPGLSMRRVLVKAWGPDASLYVGRQVRLYCDDEVMFGGQAVGGTRISHLSHIDKPVPVPLIIKRGKSAVFTVEPLTPGVEIASLRGEWTAANPERRKAIETRVAELQGRKEAAETPDADCDPTLEPGFGTGAGA